MKYVRPIKYPCVKCGWVKNPDHEHNYKEEILKKRKDISDELLEQSNAASKTKKDRRKNQKIVTVSEMLNVAKDYFHNVKYEFDGETNYSLIADISEEFHEGKE